MLISDPPDPLAPFSYVLDRGDEALLVDPLMLAEPVAALVNQPTFARASGAYNFSAVVFLD